MDVETRNIPTRLGNLHVQITRTGDPVLRWPSLLLDHPLWQAQVDHFAPREMARRIPDAEFVLLDGAAHLVALEVPDTVNTLIDDFVTRQPPSSQPSNPLHPAE